jgi:hypothetical protein
MCPWKNAQTQVEGRGVECIGRLLQFHRKAIAGVKHSRDLNEVYREIRINAAVALFVGIGQRALGDVASYAQVIELGLDGRAGKFRCREDSRGKLVARRPCRETGRDART